MEGTHLERFEDVFERLARGRKLQPTRSHPPAHPPTHHRSARCARRLPRVLGACWAAGPRPALGSAWAEGWAAQAGAGCAWVGAGACCPWRGPPRCPTSPAPLRWRGPCFGSKESPPQGAPGACAAVGRAKGQHPPSPPCTHTHTLTQAPTHTPTPTRIVGRKWNRQQGGGLEKNSFQSFKTDVSGRMQHGAHNSVLSPAHWPFFPSVCPSSTL